MKRLSDISVGGSCIATAVEGSDELALRMMEMGVLPGAELQVLGVAPLGDPLEVLVRGYRLSLRRSEAQRVTVKGAAS